MKKTCFSFILAMLLPLTCVADDTPVPEPQPPKQELKEPFNSMTPTEQTETGIKKLSTAEQEALSHWWKRKKAAPSSDVSKEVTLSEILDNGKCIVLSDGTKLYLSSSVKKKISKWKVGDKIGIGEPGHRGSLTIYHLATGRKVKVKRDQAPRHAEKSDQS
jgi:hypothetical protein